MTEIKIHGVYQHYKGDYYIVEDIAKHTENGEELVIYRGLYEDAPLWARPKKYVFRRNRTRKITLHLTGDQKQNTLTHCANILTNFIFILHGEIQNPPL